MTAIAFHLPDLLLAYSAYLLAAISPGPANLGIMATSMRNGRRAGLLFVSGVMVASLTWGLLAASGLSAFLTSYDWFLRAIKFGGGLYLLWLAYNSFLAARYPRAPVVIMVEQEPSAISHFSRGLAIHMTNPKMIIAWIAIVAISVSPGAPGWVSFLLVALCWISGVMLFSAYALIFSTYRAVAIYRASARWIEGATTVFFFVIGVKLLMLSL